MAILFKGANHFSNFVTRLQREHLCKIILKLAQAVMEEMSFEEIIDDNFFFFFFSSVGHFVQRSTTLLAVSVVVMKGTRFCKMFEINPLALEETSF